jgi:hypothetical protein
MRRPTRLQVCERRRELVVRRDLEHAAQRRERASDRLLQAFEAVGDVHPERADTPAGRHAAELPLPLAACMMYSEVKPP